jgi:hypothetical protein
MDAASCNRSDINCHSEWNVHGAFSPSIAHGTTSITKETARVSANACAGERVFLTLSHTASPSNARRSHDRDRNRTRSLTQPVQKSMRSDLDFWKPSTSLLPSHMERAGRRSTWSRVTPGAAGRDPRRNVQGATTLHELLTRKSQSANVAASRGSRAGCMRVDSSASSLSALARSERAPCR